jgi:hypothetical protein
MLESGGGRDTYGSSHVGPVKDDGHAQEKAPGTPLKSVCAVQVPPFLQGLGLQRSVPGGEDITLFI